MLRNFIKKIFRPLGMIIGCIAAVWLLVIWLGMIVGATFLYPFTHYLLPNNQGTAIMGMGSMFFLVGIPLFSMLLGIAKSFFRMSYNRYLQPGLWSFWTICFVVAIFIIASVSKQFNQGSSVSQVIPLNVTGDTLVLTGMNHENWDVAHRIGSIRLADDYLIDGDVDIKVVRSQTNGFSLTKETHASGINMQEANLLSSQVNYQYKIQGNELSLSKGFEIPRGQKFRGQRVKLTLGIPDGKFIRWNDNIKHDIYVENALHEIWQHGNTWQMTATGLQATDAATSGAKPLGKDSWSFDQKDFSRIEIEGPMEVIIQQGAEYSVRIDGQNSRESNLAKMTQTGNLLNIYTSDGDQKLRITMPTLTSLVLRNVERAKVLNFKQAQMTLRADDNDGQMHLDVYADIQDLLLEAKNCEVTMNGSGQILRINAEENAEINGFGYKVRTANIVAREGSRAEISASDSIFCRESEFGQLEINGNPKKVFSDGE